MAVNRLSRLIVIVAIVLLPLRNPAPAYAHGDLTHYLYLTLEEVSAITVAGVTPPFATATLISTVTSGSCQSGFSNPLILSDTCTFGGPPAPFPDAGNLADHQWVQMDGGTAPLIWSLPSASTRVFALPAIDHEPLGIPPTGIPYEALEFTVWGSNNAAAPFPNGWTLGTLAKIYEEGYVESGTAVGVESDDFASEWTFPTPVAFVAVFASGSVAFTPSTPDFPLVNQCGLDHWCSTDFEIDAVGIPTGTPPTAAFSWSPQVQDEGTSLQFTDMSTAGSTMIQSWQWDFAGLGTSSDQHPSFTFTDNGVYHVCLTVTDAQSSSTPVNAVIDFARNAPFPGEDNTPWPRGEVTLRGVPFRVPQTDPSVWKFEDPFVTGPNPRVLEIPVNRLGIKRVYTLINTGGGALGPTAYAWLEFWGDSGAYFRKDLVGNVDIRDYNYDGWTNAINGTTTVNVFLHNPSVYNGERRLDMQIIDLPTAFLTQRLTQIRLSDNGGDNLQRTILEGVAVHSITPPSGNAHTACYEITINNVAPTINAVTNNGPITAGGTATIIVDAHEAAGAADPLTYEFDCDNNGSYEIGPQAVNNASCFLSDVGSHPINVRVTDDDGGVVTGSTVVIVNPTPVRIATQDSFLRSGNDNTNEGANLNLVIRSDGNNRALVTFDLVGLSSPVNNASLRLYIVYNADNWGNEGRTIDAHRVTQTWTEGNGANLQPGNLTNAQFHPYETRGSGPGVTWRCAVDTNVNNQATDCNSRWNGGAYVTSPTASLTIYKDFGGNNQLPPTTATVGWISFNVTADVNTCLNNSETHCQWLIKKTQEGQPGRVEFASKEGAAAFYNSQIGEAVAPQLLINAGVGATSTQVTTISGVTPLRSVFLPVVRQ